MPCCSCKSADSRRLCVCACATAAEVALASIAAGIYLARQGVQTMAFRQDQMYASLLELFQLRSPAADRQLQLLKDSCQSLRGRVNNGIDQEGALIQYAFYFSILCFSLCCFFAQIMLKNMLFALHYAKLF